MSQIVTLLAGIVIAGGVFAATLWSTAQVFRQDGRLRSAHLGAVVLTIAGMTALQATWILGSQMIGGGLALVALCGLVLESGWNRVLPGFQVLFGGALATALPFGGM